MRKKTLIIAGPTAVGKTQLALRLAKKIGGEIISADSRQVYKYLDIGTGKDVGGADFIDKTQSLLSPGPNQFRDNYTLGYYHLEGIPIWLMDAVEPNQLFDVATYVRLVKLVFGDLRKRQKLPLIVGGAGFYLTGLVDGYDTLGIPPDPKLRARVKNWDLALLQSSLSRLDPGRWQSLNLADRQNPRRLVRAIEVARANQAGKLGKLDRPDLGQTLFIFLTAPRNYLYERIDRRVKVRLDQGMIAEIKKVLGLGYAWDDPGLNALGYRQLRLYFDGDQTLEQAVFHWQAAEHQYARQQLGWFKQDRRYRRLEVTDPDFTLRIDNLIAKWLPS